MHALSITSFNVESCIIKLNIDDTQVPNLQTVAFANGNLDTAGLIPQILIFLDIQSTLEAP